MKNESKGIRTAFILLLAVLGTLTLFMLAALAAESHSAPSGAFSGLECSQIPFDSREEITDSKSPTGTAVRYRLTVTNPFFHDTYLAFYTTHQSVRVFMDGNCVFSLEPSGNLLNIKTPGCNWTMIPIARGNAEREIIVETVPVYACVRSKAPTFLCGSERALVTSQLLSDLPQLVISIVTVMTGLIILAIAGYCLLTKLWGMGLLTLGLYAVMLGLWRFLDMRLLSLCFPEYTVFLFYFSVTMLMLCPIPLTTSLMEWHPGKNGKALRIYRVGAAAAFLAQILLQLLGIADLRETLMLTHLVIVIGIAIIVCNSIANWAYQPCTRWNSSETISWIFILGVLGDLLIYYCMGSSFGLLFTMLAFLFYVIYVGISFGAQYREQEKLLENKEKQVAQSRVTAMMGQIRSHFIFNILNAISGMCKYDPEKADKTIICFARYLRANMDIMQNDQPVTFHTALQHLEDYITLEQIRFGDKIHFVTDITQEHFMLPSLILQPIVENAIKHGLTPKPSGGTITLRTWVDGGDIKISIRDDGVGFDVNSVDESKSVGLSNVRFRLQYMMHGCLSIESTPGHGTTVTISLPQQRET